MLHRATALSVLFLAIGLHPVAASGPAPAAFDDHFTGATLRCDYQHTGTAREEHIALERCRLEGPWPGSRVHLLDDTNLGKYLVEIVDRRSNLPLYSRGFASIYGEWETTGEAAAGSWRSFHESVRFPEPRRPVQLVLKKRGADGAFRELFSTVVDPADRTVFRGPVPRRGEGWSIFEHGPPATTVDLLILGDGYTAGERDELAADAERLTEILFSYQPFADHRQDFSVRVLHVPADSPGITDPRAGRYLMSPFGLSYDAFGSERYVLTMENRRLRELAAQLPYDHLVILANNEKYGGGGILNLWTTAAAGSSQSPYLLVHEFGHSFAGLGDEYYTSSVAYQDFNPPGVEPWEPNLTALLDPERLKWRHLVADGTPLPTPWQQERYDEMSLAFQERRSELRAAGASEKTMDAYFDEVKAATGPLLEAEEHYGEIGAFEGAGYQAEGLYRPQVDCIMFSRNRPAFCQVCSEAIERVIRLYAE